MRHVLILILSGAAHAQLPGQRDLNFGTGGRAAFRFSAPSGGISIARTSNGAYLAVGEELVGANAPILCLARYTAAGAVDPSFGIGGIRKIVIPGKRLDAHHPLYPGCASCSRSTRRGRL